MSPDIGLTRQHLVDRSDAPATASLGPDAAQVQVVGDLARPHRAVVGPDPGQPEHEPHGLGGKVAAGEVGRRQGTGIRRRHVRRKPPPRHYVVDLSVPEQVDRALAAEAGIARQHEVDAHPRVIDREGIEHLTDAGEQAILPDLEGRVDIAAVVVEPEDMIALALASRGPAA